MFVVKVYTDDYGVLCLFKVRAFSDEENAIDYANEMLENGFSVEVYHFRRAIMGYKYGYKYIVLIKDRHGRVIESVGTNNKYYAKWLCDVEKREHGHICKVLLPEEDNVIL